jgi:peptidyl-dipeptidase A
LSQAWHRLVTSLEDRFRELETEFHIAYWDSQVDANPTNERRRTELELELRTFKGDSESYARVSEALEEEIHEPILKRQLELLHHSLLGNQMSEDQRTRLVELSTSIESDYASYRPVLDGKRLSENDVDEVLRTSDDEDLRRRAWEASKEIGGVVSDRVRELARIRNEVAHDLGYGDYYQLGLDLQEMDEEWLFSTLGELEEATTEPFKRWKQELDARLRERFSTEVVYPWHYTDAFFQTLPSDDRVRLDPFFQNGSAAELSVRTFEQWGIDLSKVMDRSDLYPRENKCQHAFCLHVDRNDDVRILANIVPGERWIEVMLHESGHAAFDVSIDRTLPYLLRRPAHTFVTEAIAILSGRMIREPRWLVQIAGSEDRQLSDQEESLRRASSLQSLLFTRWGLVVVHFERALYADPEAELDATWWDLVERFQLVNRPPDRAAPDWAAKIHVAAAPVYYQNYLLGEVLASQLEKTCVAECGGLVGVKDAGELLRERVFRQGSSLRWDALVEHATGRPLSARDFRAGLEA